MLWPSSVPPRSNTPNPLIQRITSQLFKCQKAVQVAKPAATSQKIYSPALPLTSFSGTAHQDSLSKLINIAPIGTNQPKECSEANQMLYQIISASSQRDLENMVNNEMRHDWIATGGLIVYAQLTNDASLAQPRTFFAQAMIKNQPQPPRKTQ